MKKVAAALTNPLLSHGTLQCIAAQSKRQSPILLRPHACTHTVFNPNTHVAVVPQCAGKEGVSRVCDPVRLEVTHWDLWCSRHPGMDGQAERKEGRRVGREGRFRKIDSM